VDKGRDLPKSVEEGNLLVDVAGGTVISRQHSLGICVERDDRHSIHRPELLAHVPKTVLGDVEFGAAITVVWKTAAHAVRGMSSMQHWKLLREKMAKNISLGTQALGKMVGYLPLMSRTKETSMGGRSEGCSAPSNFEQKSTRMNRSSLGERCGRLTRATEIAGSKTFETIGRLNWNSLKVFSLLTNTAWCLVRVVKHELL
jgi:hypothetical protein